MDIRDYQITDYRTWVLGDAAREGVNIKRNNVLTQKEIELLDFFIPYQDQRNDPGQAEWVTFHAIKLLDFVPGGIREVVVPSALAHDTGFYGYDPNYWKNLVSSGGDTEGEMIRRPHQNRGIMLMGRGFQKVGYPSEKYHFECADIVGDHDTRFLPATISGKIVRASDYTWRVSFPCIQIYLKDKSPKDILDASKKTALEGKPPFDLDRYCYDIARLEFVNSMFFKFGEDTREVLLPEYRQELEMIVSFYGNV